MNFAERAAPRIKGAGLFLASGRPLILCVLVGFFFEFTYVASSEEQSIVSLEAGIVSMAKEISASMTKASTTKIAVMNFVDPTSRSSTLCDYLAESLTTELFRNSQFDIYERSLLKEVLKEHKLVPSGLIEPSTAKEIGRLTGAEAVVTGTIVEMSGAIGINVRVISTETGKVFSATRTVVAKDENVSSMLGHTGGEGGDKSSDQGTGHSGTPSSAKRTFRMLTPGTYAARSTQPHQTFNPMKIRSVQVEQGRLNINVDIKASFGLLARDPYVTDSLGRRYGVIDSNGAKVERVRDWQATGESYYTSYTVHTGTFQLTIPLPANSPTSGLTLNFGGDQAVFEVLTYHSQ